MTALRGLADASRDLAELPGRRRKVERIAALLRGCDAANIETVARWMTGDFGPTVLGIGTAQVASALSVEPAPTPTLTATAASDALVAMARTRGAGSKRIKAELLAQLFAKATADEQRFVARLLLGELRQGALAALMLEAVSAAFSVPLASVRRAHMLTGDCGAVAAIARRDGRPGIDAVQLQLFHPIQPMLAQPADDVTEALGALGRPLLEYKLDGARVQVHKQAEEVRVYSRKGNDVTAAVPEIVEQIGALPVSDLVLDGETLSIADDGQPRPFQTTMRRFGRHRDDAVLRAQLPLRAFYFDCLRLAGETLIDADLLTRRAALREVIPAPALMPAIQTAAAKEAAAFLARAVAAGHEGLMAKSSEAPYAAGGRGSQWLKIKQVQTLDLVVLGAEWGSGRRQGWLSNLHLGARTDDGFVMLGKTFKGLTDECLAWQTEQLLSRATDRQGGLVQVRPELVVEVAFNELQRSRQYPAGLALRFARVRGYRHDKSAADADHIDSVQALFARQLAYQERGPSLP